MDRRGNSRRCSRDTVTFGGLKIAGCFNNIMLMSVRRWIGIGTGLVFCLALIWWNATWNAKSKRAENDEPGLSHHPIPEGHPGLPQSDREKTRNRNEIPAALRNRRRVSDMLPKSVYFRDIGTKKDFSLVDDNGKLSPQALRYAGVSADNTEEIQKLYDSFRETLKNHLLENLRPDPSSPTGEKNGSNYVIAPFPELGAAALEDFAKAVDHAVGGPTRERLLSTFNVNSDYSGLGQYEMYLKVRISSQPYDSPITGYDPGHVVSFDQRDPSSGKSLGGGQMTLKTFEKQTGVLFDIDSPPP